MHTLPDDLTRLTPEQLLDAYRRSLYVPCSPADDWAGPAHIEALRAELLRRLRVVPAPGVERHLVMHTD